MDQLLSERYRILNLLGQGGFSSVYQGIDTVLDREVAIKVLKRELAQKEEMVERFMREAKVAASLKHPHSLRIFDYGQSNGELYIVSELLSGVTLDAFITDQAITEDWLITHFIPLCHALQEAHDAGIIHRDLKPSNLFFHQVPGDERLILIDFGISKGLEEVDQKVTETGQLFGTPHYMSPEQVQDPKAMTPSSDLYSLGVIIFELLSGSTPFHDDNVFGLLLQHVNEAPPQLLDVAPRQSPAMSLLVNELLAKDPEARPRSALEVSSRLIEIGKIWQEETSEFDGTPLTTGDAGKKLFLLSWSFLIGFLLTIILIIWGMSQGPSPKDKEQLRLTDPEGTKYSDQKLDRSSSLDVAQPDLVPKSTKPSLPHSDPHSESSDLKDIPKTERASLPIDDSSKVRKGQQEVLDAKTERSTVSSDDPPKAAQSKQKSPDLKSASIKTRKAKKRRARQRAKTRSKTTRRKPAKDRSKKKRTSIPSAKVSSASQGSKSIESRKRAQPSRGDRRPKEKEREGTEREGTEREGTESGKLKQQMETPSQSSSQTQTPKPVIQPLPSDPLPLDVDDRTSTKPKRLATEDQSPTSSTTEAQFKPIPLDVAGQDAQEEDEPSRSPSPPRPPVGF